MDEHLRRRLTENALSPWDEEWAGDAPSDEQAALRYAVQSYRPALLDMLDYAYGYDVGEETDFGPAGEIALAIASLERVHRQYEIELTCSDQRSYLWP